MPLEVSRITRRRAETFLDGLFTKGVVPKTVANRYRNLQHFFRWLEAEGEIRDDQVDLQARQPLQPSWCVSRCRAAPAPHQRRAPSAERRAAVLPDR